MAKDCTCEFLLDDDCPCEYCMDAHDEEMLLNEEYRQENRNE